MKSILYALLFATALTLTTQANAAPGFRSLGKVGVGVVGGVPWNGVSTNVFLDQYVSIQTDAVFHYWNQWMGVGGRVDLLLWLPSLASMSWADFVIYFGPGANVVWFLWSGKGSPESNSLTSLHGEVTAGLGLLFSRLPVDIVVDVTPVLLLLNSSSAEKQKTGLVVSAHARWYF